MRLLFDHHNKAIVMKLGDKYYDMRRGELCSKPTNFSSLKPFNKEFKTKWESVSNIHLSAIKALNGEEIEYGYSFSFGKLRVYLIFDTQDCYQISGTFPLYFLKSFNHLIKTL